LSVNRSLKEYSLKVYEKEFPKVELVTMNNTPRLMKESSEFRKNVRGESIGQLG